MSFSVSAPVPRPIGAAPQTGKTGAMCVTMPFKRHNAPANRPADGRPGYTGANNYPHYTTGVKVWQSLFPAGCGAGSAYRSCRASAFLAREAETIRRQAENFVAISQRLTGFYEESGVFFTVLSYSSRIGSPQPRRSFFCSFSASGGNYAARRKNVPAAFPRQKCTEDENPSKDNEHRSVL